MKRTPLLDPRTKADLAKQLQQLLAEYVPDWQAITPNPDTGDRLPQGNFAALTNVFIRFCEITIQHLNRVPDKNFLAFLDLLGAAPQPPQSARVPLTFSLAAGSSLALVPAGTQVSAPPALGDDQPVIYETEEPLVVTAVRLIAAFGRDLAQDRYEDYQGAIALNPNTLEIFRCNQPIVHRFYLAHDRLFHLPGLTQIHLQVSLQAAIPTSPENPRDGRSLKWDYWDGQRYAEITPQDGTNALTQSGEIIFLPPNQPQDLIVNGLKHSWLRCSLNEPITLVEIPTSNITIPNGPTPGMVRHTQLPRIASMAVNVEVARSGLRLDAAFVNQSPVDLSRPFAPFGPIPKVGDVLYLACQDGFSQLGSIITLNLDVGNVAAFRDNNLRLQWEFWNGQQWQSLGVAAVIRERIDNLISDTTNAFTVPGDKEVQFTISTEPKAISINGVENFWVRVRITAGGYGQVARITPGTTRDNQQRQIIDYVAATLSPPLINTINLDYQLTTPPENLEQIQTQNHRTYRYFPSIPDGRFSPFETVLEGRSRSTHFGFQLPPELSLQNRLLSLFVQAAVARYGDGRNAVEDASPTPPILAPQLRWQYWNGQEWWDLTVEDETKNFIRSGLVKFLPPEDWQKREDFGSNDLHWLRVVWERGRYAPLPRVTDLLTNTVMAAQTLTLKEEILGASDGTADQLFTTARSPVLDGQQLEVYEAEELNQQRWRSWQEVNDFYGSGPRDRHYLLNHLTGIVQFGNGVNGRIPLAGRSNIRMTYYQTGGGHRGNRSSNEISQLTTTVPYIDRVTNLEPASGGADAESLGAFMARAPLTIRHGGRAVTVEDFEDLALLASSSVARARCVPLLNLQADPLAIIPDRSPQLGEVSVIIVPDTTDIQPNPSLELIDRVRNYLANHSNPTINLSVIGPLYVQVNVEVELVPTSLDVAGMVEQSVQQTLTQFLHPLTGGFDGTGWFFGRKPHKSDFYALLEAVPNVDHIHALRITPEEIPLNVLTDDPIQAILRTNRFLVYSGQHRIKLLPA
jgi:hypothetical protein